MQHISRRSLLCAMSALLGTSALTGCGFRLRGHFSAPFETLYLQMSATTPFAGELKRTIEAGSDVQIVSEPGEADAILELMSMRRGRDVLSINDSGRAREYEVTLAIDFRCVSPEGFDYVEKTTLTASRNLTYTDSEFLSREKEEAILYRDMESDLIGQITRRLAAARRPEGH